MTLTSSDLKQIRTIVHEEIKDEIAPVRQEMKKGFKRLEKKLDYSVGFLDKQHITLHQRTKRIEAELGFPVSSL